MLENWEIHGFKQRLLFSFSLSNLPIPKPQLTTSVCKEGLSQGSMYRDLSYPFTDNFWCRKFCKVTKCQHLSQMVIFIAVLCCGCLPSQTCRSCQCMTQLVSVESTEWLQESSPSANCGCTGMQKETQRSNGGHQSVTWITSIMTHSPTKVWPTPQKSLKTMANDHNIQRKTHWPGYQPQQSP